MIGRRWVVGGREGKMGGDGEWGGMWGLGGRWEGGWGGVGLGVEGS